MRKPLLCCADTACLLFTNKPGLHNGDGPACTGILQLPAHVQCGPQCGRDGLSKWCIMPERHSPG